MGVKIRVKGSRLGEGQGQGVKGGGHGQGSRVWYLDPLCLGKGVNVGSQGRGRVMVGGQDQGQGGQGWRKVKVRGSREGVMVGGLDCGVRGAVRFSGGYSIPVTSQHGRHRIF